MKYIIDTDIHNKKTQLVCILNNIGLHYWAVQLDKPIELGEFEKVFEHTAEIFYAVYRFSQNMWIDGNISECVSLDLKIADKLIDQIRDLIKKEKEERDKFKIAAEKSLITFFTHLLKFRK